MSYLEDQLQDADEEDLENIFMQQDCARRRAHDRMFKRSDCINRFTAVEFLPPTKENVMSQEERTRDEVLNCLIAQTQALTLVCQMIAKQMLPRAEIQQPPPGSVQPPEIAINPPKPARAKKDKPLPPTPPEVTKQDVENAVARGDVPVEKMVDIKPTKPGKTLADLRVVLQECITKHGMPVAKERLAPYMKVSDVPDEAIAIVIEKLAA